MRFLRHDLRFLRGLRRVMHHRVGVFDASTISTGVLLQEAHKRVVMLLVFPVALPFEQRPDSRQPDCAGLNRNLVRLTDAVGHVTSYQYDGLYRRTVRTLPLSMSESYSYDAHGHVSTIASSNRA